MNKARNGDRCKEGLGGAIMGGQGWLRGSITHQNIRSLLVVLSLVLDRSQALYYSPKALKKLFGGIISFII